MRHILQAFTMYIGTDDYGYDTEEVELPLPSAVEQEYRGGGMDLGVNQSMAALEPLECTIKMAGHSPDLMKLIARGPGKKTRFTFRASVLEEANGQYVPHVAVVEGEANKGTRDRWQRGEKSGIEIPISGIMYFRYEANDEVIHELQAWPPRRIVGGVDELSIINQNLGY